MKIHLYFLNIDDDEGIHDIIKGYVRSVLCAPKFDVKLNFHTAFGAPNQSWKTTPFKWCF